MQRGEMDMDARDRYDTVTIGTEAARTFLYLVEDHLRRMQIDGYSNQDLAPYTALRKHLQQIINGRG